MPRAGVAFSHLMPAIYSVFAFVAGRLLVFGRDLRFGPRFGFMASETSRQGMHSRLLGRRVLSLVDVSSKSFSEREPKSLGAI